ncbi:MAG: PEP-CTERM sorting domain-containing protein [Planctomycetota bacterium]|jgi:hypothetical protein
MAIEDNSLSIIIIVITVVLYSALIPIYTVQKAGIFKSVETMKRVLFTGFLALVFLAGIGVSRVEATTVTFYTDRTAFESQLSSSSTIDFEGIVADTGYTDYNVSMTDVDFSGNTLRIVGKNPTGGWNGAPYQSALLANTYNHVITADLTSAGSGFTAVGGWFGSLWVDATTTLTLYGTNGVLDTRTVTAGNVGAGESESFYGWIVNGDEITNVTHNTVTDWETIDNFTYGYAIPEPSYLVFAGIGLAGVWSVRRFFAI